MYQVHKGGRSPYLGKSGIFAQNHPRWVCNTHSPQWILNSRPHSPTNYYRRRTCQLRYSSLAKLYFCAISEISLIWVIFMCVLYPNATWKIIRQQLMKFEFDWVCTWDGWNFRLFFYHLAYFCYYSWVPLHFLILFIGPTVLFQLPLALFIIFSAKNFQF